MRLGKERRTEHHESAVATGRYGVALWSAEKKTTRRNWSCLNRSDLWVNFAKGK
jgi:hypothetical protein